jgi:drug/metabolite transporter (DMT)-like permease
MLDESVPFYTIAMHGLVDYLCGDYMDFYEQRSQLLEAIAKGGNVSFTLTWEGTEKLAMADTAAGGADALRGDLLALAGSVCVAVYTMIGSVCRRTVSTTVYTFVVYLTAAVTVLAVNLAAGIPVAGYGAADYGAALGMAVFCTLLGHSLFSWGLKYLPAAFISVVKLMEPVFAALWALLLFREVPGIAVVLGGGLIVAGLVLYSLTAEEKRPAEEV